MRLVRAVALDRFLTRGEFAGRRRRRRRRKSGKRTRQQPQQRFQKAKRVVEEVEDLPLEELVFPEEEELEEADDVGSVRWGPSARMGRLRISAPRGIRAAVIELKPGLYVVAEVPERSLEGEFGVLPLLAPMVMNAARKALAPPAQPQPAMIPAAPQPAPVAPQWHQPQPVKVGCAQCEVRR